MYTLNYITSINFLLSTYIIYVVPQQNNKTKSYTQKQSEPNKNHLYPTMHTYLSTINSRKISENTSFQTAVHLPLESFSCGQRESICVGQHVDTIW